MKSKFEILILIAIMTVPVSESLCAQQADKSVEIRATDFVDASDGVAKKGDHVVVQPGNHWFAFDAKITTAGRYRVDVVARATSDQEAVVNVEDYIDNQDGRNYDITSAMIPPQSDSFETVSKFGSPLNVGVHKMKLNVNGGGAAIQSITFRLIKPHELTPFTLKQNVDGEKWVMVWSDEFETDGQPNPKVWAHDIGNWGWGNREPQYYTEGRLENARCEGGRLIIEARKDKEGGGWTSARLTTRGRMSLLYGRIEFRAKTTVGNGNWAAIWLLGDQYRDEKSWPYCGEVDMLENVGREIDDESGDGMTHFSCHTRAYYFKQNNHISTQKKVAQLGGKFHDYALEWTPEAMKLFFDGEHVYTYDKNANDLEFPFNQPQNLIINMAMGGGMGGDIDPSLARERMEVEYVRVYGRQ